MKQIFLAAAVILLIAGVIGFTVARDWIKATFYIDHMEQDKRIERMNVQRIVNSLAIKEGDRVADIGAGSGLFTRLFAEKTGNAGKVFAVDINPELLKHIDRISREGGIKNIVTVRAVSDDPKIPEPVDLIFICDTLHYIENQEAYVQTMARYLGPGGRIAVVDFLKNWPPLSVRFTPEDLTRWMNNAGLEKAGYHDFIQDEYLMIFVKR